MADATIDPDARTAQTRELAAVAAELGALRRQSHQDRYGSGAPPELPAREAMIQIVDELIAVMFPRHFGPREWHGPSLDDYVRIQLEATLESLERQAHLELGLSEPDARPPGGAQAKAASIARRFIQGLPRIRAILETDIRAAYEGDPAANSLDEVMCCYPGIAAIIRHRLAHGLFRLGVPMLARIVSEVAHTATGIDIHPGAEIGEAFFVDHGTGVVIGETAIIGARVRLYQGVTLGARRFEVSADGALEKHYPRHPIIEDDVVIYAGATVLGRITVGRGSVISGSVWLTQAVPPGSNVTQALASRSVIA